MYTSYKLRSNDLYPAYEHVASDFVCFRLQCPIFSYPLLMILLQLNITCCKPASICFIKVGLKFKCLRNYKSKLPYHSI